MILDLFDLLNSPTWTEHEALAEMRTWGNILANRMQRPIYLLRFPDPKSPALALSTHRKSHWQTHSILKPEVN